MKWYYSVGNIIVISSVVVIVSLRFPLHWLSPISDSLSLFFSYDFVSVLRQRYVCLTETNISQVWNIGEVTFL